MEQSITVSESVWTTNSIAAVFSDLLIESEMVSYDNLMRAAELRKSRRCTLTRALHICQMADLGALEAALTVTALVNQGRINHYQAVCSLMLVHVARIPLEAALEQLGANCRDVFARGRLCEILILAGLFPPNYALEYLEIALLEKCQIGRCLLERGVITQQILDLALGVQYFVRNGKIAYDAAGRVLETAVYRRLSARQAAIELGLFEQPGGGSLAYASA